MDNQVIVEWWGAFLAIVAIAVGILAVFLALPPFAKMVWGRPLLKISFPVNDLCLSCEIQSIPISNRILMAMNIERRNIKEFRLGIYICHKRTEQLDPWENQVYDEGYTRTLHWDGFYNECISLLPSYQIGRANIVKCKVIKPHVAKAFICDREGKPYIKLKNGAYLLEVDIWADGKEFFATIDFEVSNNKPWLKWLQNEYSKGIFFRV